MPRAANRKSNIPMASKLPRRSGLPVFKKTTGEKPPIKVPLSDRPSLIPFIAGSINPGLSNKVIPANRADTSRRQSIAPVPNSERRKSVLNGNLDVTKKDCAGPSRQVNSGTNNVKKGRPSPRRSILRPVPGLPKPSVAAASSRAFDKRRQSIVPQQFNGRLSIAPQQFSGRLSIAPQQPVEYPRPRKSIYQSRHLDNSGDSVHFRPLWDRADSLENPVLLQRQDTQRAIVQPRRSIYAIKRPQPTPKKLPSTSTPVSARKVSHREANASGDITLSSIRPCFLGSGVRDLGTSVAVRPILSASVNQASHENTAVLPSTNGPNGMRRTTLELEEFYSDFSPDQLEQELEMVSKRKSIIERLLIRMRASSNPPPVQRVQPTPSKTRLESSLQLETIAEGDSKERDSTTSENKLVDSGHLDTVMEMKERESTLSSNTTLQSASNIPKKRKGKRKARRSLNRRCIGGDGMILRPRNRNGKY